jgi:hypothetical protein
LTAIGSSVLLSTSSSSVQATCELVGDLKSEGTRGDGEHGLGIQLRLGGLPSWVLLDMLHVNVLQVSLLVHVVLDGLIIGANLGDLAHDFKLGFFLLRYHFLECITI